MKDYFPLAAGTQHIYEYSSSEFDGLARVVVIILSVKGGKKTVSVSARMRVELKGHASTTDYAMRKTAAEVVSDDGIVVGGRIEFPLPPQKGRKWEAYPDTSEIVSLTDKIEVPAGKFRDCMKIVTLLSGGDSGSAVRYYAPGVGYVYEKYNSDDIRAEVSLVSVGKALPEDMKPSRMQPLPLPGGEEGSEDLDVNGPNWDGSPAARRKPKGKKKKAR